MTLLLAFASPLSILPRTTSSLLFTSHRQKPAQFRLSPTRGPVVKCCVEVPPWKKLAIDPDFAKDEQLQILEEELDIALKAENYRTASELREKLMRLQSAAYVDVLTTNMKFYKAFTAGSIVDMASCWMQDNGITCKHPYAPIGLGYLEVLNHFGYLFTFGLPEIEVRDVRISMRGSMALVTCEEHSIDRDGIQESKLMSAVNIYQKRNGQWYIFHHSCTPIYKPSEF